MNEIDRKLKWIENRLSKIAEPNKERTISPTAKMREAKELWTRMSEIQVLIDNEDDLTAKFIHQQYFDEYESVRREIIFPLQVFEQFA